MAKLFIEESTLTAIGDAIRGKEGSTELIPVNDMATRISAIESGGGGGYVPTDEELTLTGDCQRAFMDNKWVWLIDKYGDRITTKDITNSSNMFRNCNTITSIPFDFNFSTSHSNASYMFCGCTSLKHIPDFTLKTNSYTDTSSMFNQCSALESVPYVYEAYPSSLSNIFYYCENVRNIPDDYFDTWNFSRMMTYSNASASSMFDSCSSLRKIPSSLFEKFTDSVNTAQSRSLYNSLCPSCYALDELVGLPVFTATVTSNQFAASYSTIAGNCYRLKNFTFATNADGTAKTAKWKSQTIDLTTVGHYPAYLSASGMNNSLEEYCPILKYNSGITLDKCVRDDASYQALKNDPDWFTAYSTYNDNQLSDIDKQPNYSRYNHNSAVATINSLPDTSAYLASAGGTNTIKFKGIAGARTDGGAINTLTEEEIAVAAAKGWTVTLV